MKSVPREFAEWAALTHDQQVVYREQFMRAVCQLLAEISWQGYIEEVS